MIRNLFFAIIVLVQSPFSFMDIFNFKVDSTHAFKNDEMQSRRYNIYTDSVLTKSIGYNKKGEITDSTLYNYTDSEYVFINYDVSDPEYNDYEIIKIDNNGRLLNSSTYNMADSQATITSVFIYNSSGKIEKKEDQYIYDSGTESSTAVYSYFSNGLLKAIDQQTGFGDFKSEFTYDLELGRASLDLYQDGNLSDEHIVFFIRDVKLDTNVSIQAHFFRGSSNRLLSHGTNVPVSIVDLKGKKIYQGMFKEFKKVKLRGKFIVIP